MLNFNENSHRRKNPLTGDWVLVSPNRMKRPWEGQFESTRNIRVPEYDSNCYLCPGNKRSGGEINPEYKGTFVFQNDFPALNESEHKQHRNEISDDEIFQTMEISGTCRVICFSPNHSKTMPEMNQAEILQVIKTWISQSIELGNSYKWVQIFENKGEMMGCSNPHPHGQIWATNVLPSQAIKEDQFQKKYYNDNGKLLLEIYSQREIYFKIRVIETNDSWLAVVPYWATWPFEILLLPLRVVHRLSDLNSKEQVDLSNILKNILTRYDNLFEISFPYSMGWHEAPLYEESKHWLLHAHFFPPLLRSPNVKKFLVGYELLSESQRDLTPEHSAEKLREQSVIHYRETL